MERQDLGSRKQFTKNERKSYSPVRGKSYSYSYSPKQISRSVMAPVLDPGGLFKGYELHKVAQLSTSVEEMASQ